MKTDQPQLASVASWLKQNEHSRAWLAEKIGMSKSTVSKILLGQRACSISTLKKIAEIIGQPVEKLAKECAA